MSHPFRFVAPLPPLGPAVRAWRDEVRRIEGAGFAAVSVSDHLVGGWSMEPLLALGAAAEAAPGLRVMTIVFNADLRHPALLHKAAATLDVLTEGRLDLGLGAGWLASEYDALGIPFPPGAVRVERLAEAVVVIKRLFAGEDVRHDGRHYQIAGLLGAPMPVQRPHPPILLAGGTRPMLALAGREADFAGIAPVMAGAREQHERLAELTPRRVHEKLEWLRAAATEAGRDPAAIVLQLNPSIVGPDPGTVRTEGWIRDLEPAILADEGLTSASPYVLIGDLERSADRLEAIREEFGFSVIRLPGDPERWAPLVRRLTGR